MNRTPVKSTNLKSIGYDPKTRTLEIEFHTGHVHQYANISPAQHTALVQAKSIGSHFHEHFRPMKSKPIT